MTDISEDELARLGWLHAYDADFHRLIAAYREQVRENAELTYSLGSARAGLKTVAYERDQARAERDANALQLAAVREALEKLRNSGPVRWISPGAEGSAFFELLQSVDSILASPAPEAVARIEARLAAGDALERDAKALYERVQMDESVGICLSSRGETLLLGQTLAAHERAKEGA
jgi:hypothetical protein